MKPEEGTHHRATPHDPEAATLPGNPTATIQFEGLILGAFNKAKRLYQAGVHTNTDHHHLVITVKRNGDDITAEALPDWDTSLEIVRKLAPFWLYVDSGNGMNPKTFNASLYKPDDTTDPLSFGHIFNFVRRHGRELPLTPARFATFNFPQGTVYSADNEPMQLLQVDQGQSPPPATPLEIIPAVSKLVAINIADVSDASTKRELVLLGGEKREFFRLPLKAETTYEINLDNRPIHHTRNGDEDPEQHFLKYYELFTLNPGEKRFFLEPVVDSEDSPPCVGTSGSSTGGLGGGGS